MSATITEFIHLNGYGLYVWPAFGFAALVLGGMAWRVVARLRASDAALRAVQEKTP